MLVFVHLPIIAGSMEVMWRGMKEKPRCFDEGSTFTFFAEENPLHTYLKRQFVQAIPYFNGFKVSTVCNYQIGQISNVDVQVTPAQCARCALLELRRPNPLQTCLRCLDSWAAFVKKCAI